MAVLKIESKAFDLKWCLVKFDKFNCNYYARGTRIRSRKTSKWKYDLVSVWYGKHEFCSFDKQALEAHKFIKNNIRIMQLIARKCPDSNMYIDFPVTLKGGDIAVEQIGIGSDLIGLCNRSGISLNIALYH